MPCFVSILAMLFPRVMIVILWFLTDWFSGLFNSILFPILGLIFAPFTFLWYSVVMNYFGGEWSLIPIIGIVIALLTDFGSWGSSAKSRRHKG